MSDAYRARATRFRRDVAIKVLPATSADNDRLTVATIQRTSHLVLFDQAK